MSLVNKMLRDLDARRAAAGDRAALPAAVTPLAARQSSHRVASWRWPGALLVAGLAAAAWFGMRPGYRDAPAPAPVPTAPAPAPAPAAPAPVAVLAQPYLRMAEGLSVVQTPVALPPRKGVTPKAVEAPATGVVPSRSPVVAHPREPQLANDGLIEKQSRLPSPTERAELEYRRGVLAQHQGNAADAAGNYRAALAGYPEHAAARQTLAALLIEARRFDEAEELLGAGTELAPVRLASTLALARLKVERNQAPAALELLLKNAASGERSAEYQGFAAALLNRAGRTADAVERYQAATRLAPGEARWWAGLGIVLDASGRGAEAREAWQKARSLPGLPADLAQHIEQRLR